MMKHILKVTFLFFIFSTLASAENVGVYSADRYFNLGNTAYNAGHYGEAVYNYEKALILEPKAEDVLINLQLAIERLDTDIIELEPFFLARWWTNFSSNFLPGTWKIISIFCFFCFLAIVFSVFFNGKNENRTYYVIGVTFLLMTLVFALAGTSRSRAIFDSKFAVITEGADSIYQGPDLVSEKIKPVVSGVKVKILDSNNEWYKVATMDSEQGWLKKENVRLLKYEYEGL